MNDPETAIRSELNIPPEAQHVVILSMDAHMDWDWTHTFQDNLENGSASARKIIASAFQLLAQYHSATNPYYYSICEMGFLQAAIKLDPDLTKDFAERIGDRLRIVGGGMTSPDSLLSHGETFIRNYLLGKVFLDATLGLHFRQAYLPDDFGHDSQLPIVLQAMGFQGVSFSRIPGSWPSFQRPSNGEPSLADQLWEGGADFVWEASDGSTVVSHFLQASYLQGNGIEQPDVLTTLQSYLYEPQRNNPTGGNLGSSPTPYVYVPCGGDFALPIPGLLDDAAHWNAANYHGNAGDVFAVVATLDDYLRLIATYTDGSASHQYGPYTNLQTRSCFPTPYWTGICASRAALKILHQEATRNLLAAETFAAIANMCQRFDAPAWQPIHDARDAAVRQGWATLVPSTHHDYVTGTSLDAVYTGEQLPLLRTAAGIGAGARDSAMVEIASLAATDPQSGETPVLVFNQLGFPRSGLVEIEPGPGISAKSVRQGATPGTAVQHTSRDSMLLMAEAPSLGYDSVYLSPAPPPTSSHPGMLSVTTSGDGSSYRLENQYLEATISREANWGLTSLLDKNGGEMIVPGRIGNDLVFYLDTGGLYCFGNETDGTALYPDPAGSFTAGDAVLEEVGPLRLTLRTTATFRSGEISAPYVREYTLVAGEPFLRMSVTGASPGAEVDASYSVMVTFPLADAEAPGGEAVVSGVTYGTPYHWVSQMPEPYWSPPIFQATHNFVLPRAESGYLCAIYHADVHAWAVAADNSLIGCILRNTPATAGRGASGTGTEAHTRRYALRVRSGLQDPSTCMPLRESLQFQTPLRATSAGPAGQSGTLPGSFSLAGITTPGAIIMAAKQGAVDPKSLILRIYQPTNNARRAPLTVWIDLTNLAASLRSGAPSLSARLVTALEAEIPGQQDLPVAGGVVSFTVDRALTTLRIAAH